MDYRACIQRSIDYIEEHLQDGIGLEDLAALAGFSPYHYCRVFQYSVGISVMDYVRQRRMAHAAAELVTGQRVLDVAVKYGFDTHAGFTKAFRKALGLTPERYRRLGTGCVPAKADLMRLVEYNIRGGVVMQPKIVFRPSCKIAGFELQTTADGSNQREIPAFWDRYFAENWCSVLHQQINPVSHHELGICFPSDPATGRFSYVIGVEVENYDRVPAELFRAELPAATYAVFTTPPADRANGQFSAAIQGTWQYIWDEWFPSSGYEYAAGAVDFELYDERSSGDTGLVMDIYVPIRRVPSP